LVATRALTVVDAELNPTSGREAPHVEPSATFGRPRGVEVIRMNTTVSGLPKPSTAHATRAWCRQGFATIVELIDHVDAGHLGPKAAA